MNFTKPNIAGVFDRKTARLWNWPLWSKRALFGGMVFVVAVLDYLTGPVLSLSLFYIAPIFLATWFVSLGEGLMFCAVATVFGVVADHVLQVGFANSIVHFWNEAGVAVVYFIIAALTSSVRNAKSDANQLIRVDLLTGVYNRRAFLEAARMEIARLGHVPSPLTVIFLGINHLQNLNKKGGLEVGDMALILTTKMLKASVRAMDVVARLGGDEFAILLPGATDVNAQEIIAHIQAGVAYESKTMGHPFDLSIGSVTFLVPPRHLQEIIDQGTHALDAAKSQEGRGVFTKLVMEAAAV